MNADGWDDIFIASSMNYPHRYGINSMLLNNRGEKFLDAEFLLGIEPRAGGRTHTPWFDLDCLQEGIGTDLCRGQSGKITVMAPLGSRSAAIFDLDGDGDLDIVTNDFNSAPQVLVSDLAAAPGDSLDRSRRSPAPRRTETASARPCACAPAAACTRSTTTASPAIFRRARCRCISGSATPTTIDRVEVDWPSGRKQVETEHLETNRTRRIVERQ